MGIDEVSMRRIPVTWHSDYASASEALASLDDGNTYQIRRRAKGRFLIVKRIEGKVESKLSANNEFKRRRKKRVRF